MRSDWKTRQGKAKEAKTGHTAQLRQWLRMYNELERAIIRGHPQHPVSRGSTRRKRNQTARFSAGALHRTCFPQNPLLPLDPEDLLSVIEPGIVFASIPRASVEITGPFEQVLSRLLPTFHIGAADPEKIIIPCLKRQVLAVERSLALHSEFL